MIGTLVIFGAGTAFGVLCGPMLRKFYQQFLKPLVDKIKNR